MKAEFFTQVQPGKQDIVEVKLEPETLPETMLCEALLSAVARGATVYFTTPGWIRERVRG